MRTPKYIRVAGQLFRRREVAQPEFIVRSGYVYRQSKTGTENVEAIDALTKLNKVVSAIVPKLKVGSKLHTLMKFAVDEIPKILNAIAGNDRDATVNAIASWTDLKEGLAVFQEKLQQANKPVLYKTFSAVLTAADEKVDTLSRADSLDVKEFTTDAPEKTTIDYGEYAPEQKQLKASVSAPKALIFQDKLYRPLVPLTREAKAWATSTNPKVVRERKAFSPELIKILASGAA